MFTPLNCSASSIALAANQSTSSSAQEVKIPASVTGGAVANVMIATSDELATTHCNPAPHCGDRAAVEQSPM
jgi:hypothetical protein